MSNSKPEHQLGKSCQICGRSLEPGELKYILKLQIWADFDGHLPEKDDPSQMGKILEEMERTDPEELESQVHHTQYFLICPICRKTIIRKPLADESEPGDQLFSLH